MMPYYSRNSNGLFADFCRFFLADFRPAPSPLSWNYGMLVPSGKAHVTLAPKPRSCAGNLTSAIDFTAANIV